MSDLRLEVIQGKGDQQFIDRFSTLRDQVRAKEYKIGGPGEAQVRALIQWGLQHDANFWVVSDPSGQLIARLCARVSPHLPQHGTIGLFEIDLKSSHHQKAFELISTAAVVWLGQKGIKNIAAPIDMNTWFSYRFSIPGKHFFPRLTWEPTNPPEYNDLFKAAGFKDFAHFHTVFFPHFRIGNFCVGTGPMKRSYNHLHAQGFKLRPFDKVNFVSHELPIFHEISHEAFAESLLFEPIDLSTFSNLYAAALKTYDFSPSSVLISPEGETAGFIFAFYDGDYLVIKSLAIRKKFQGQNLSSGLIYNAAKQSFALNKKGTISALVKTGLASESIEKNVKKTLWFSWSHYYVLLNKELP